MTPCLGIIIPAYNAKSTIKECLQSILSECRQNIEIIVVDDGSADGTKEECLSVECPTLRVFKQTNAGVSAARNKGIELARGEYIMFVDADDVLQPQWFNLVAPYLDGSEDMVIFMNGLKKGYYTTDELVGSVVGVGPRQFMKGRTPIKWASSPFSRIYSSRFLKRYGLRFDSRIINGEDALLNLKAFLMTERIRFVGESFYYYRIHSKSATHRFDQRFLESNEIYLVNLEEILSSSGFYTQKEIKSLVDFSFCRSIEIMALRAAWVKNADERMRAVTEISGDPFVGARMSGKVDTGGNVLHERVVYGLAELGLLHAAVDLLRIALALKGQNGTQESWVNI